MGRANSSGVEIRDNSLRLSFMYQGKRCKETVYLDGAPLPPTPPNIRYASRLAAEIKDRIQNGRFVYAEYFPDSPKAKDTAPKSNMLFDVMDSWLALLSLKASTITQYTRRIDHFWKKHLKNEPVDKIRYSDIMAALKNGTWSSGKSRNNELSMIKGVFEHARRDGMIKSNPCEEIEYVAWQRPPPDPFSLAEVQIILAFVQQHYHEQTLNYAQFMFFSGLRTNEGIGLRWPDIDFVREEAKIEGGVVYDEETSTTKTHKARKVKLNTMAMQALKRQKVFTFLADEHVFHDPKSGKPWAYQKITDTRTFWSRTLKQTGLRYRRPYNTRHTYATIGLMAGANPAYLAKQLGHSVKVFFDIYTDWINGSDNDREMQKIEASLSAVAPEVPPKLIQKPSA